MGNRKLIIPLGNFNFHSCHYVSMLKDVGDDFCY